MARCNNCGCESQGNQKFCMECGASLEKPGLDLNYAGVRSYEPDPKPVPRQSPLTLNLGRAGSPKPPAVEEAPVPAVEEEPAPAVEEVPAPAGICPGCGEALKPGDKFCGGCGKSVASAQADNADEALMGDSSIFGESADDQRFAPPAWRNGASVAAASAPVFGSAPAPAASFQENLQPDNPGLFAGESDGSEVNDSKPANLLQSATAAGAGTWTASAAASEAPARPKLESASLLTSHDAPGHDDWVADVPASSEPRNGSVSQGCTNNSAADGRPESYLVFSILTTLFCCLPLGAVAIYFSSQVNSLADKGDFEGARAKSHTAKIINWVCVGLAVLNIAGWFMLFFVAGVLDSMT